jgi:hypothetical protein
VISQSPDRLSNTQVRQLYHKSGKVYYKLECELGYLSQQSVWLQTGWPGFIPRQRQRISLLASASRPAVGPTQPPIQWLLGVLSLRVKRSWGMMLTTHSHLMQRSRTSRSYTSPLPTHLDGMYQRQLYFTNWSTHIVQMYSLLFCIPHSSCRYKSIVSDVNIQFQSWLHYIVIYHLSLYFFKYILYQKMFQISHRL